MPVILILDATIQQHQPATLAATPKIVTKNITEQPIIAPILVVDRQPYNIITISNVSKTKPKHQNASITIILHGIEVSGLAGTKNIQ
jgi:hypothetical protein